MPELDFSNFLQQQLGANQPLVKLGQLPPIPKFGDFMQQNLTVTKPQPTAKIPVVDFKKFVNTQVSVTNTVPAPTKQMPLLSPTDYTMSSTPSLLVTRPVEMTPQEVQDAQDLRNKGALGLYASKADSLVVNPLYQYAKSIVVPTEEQKQFEQQTGQAAKSGWSKMNLLEKGATETGLPLFHLMSRIFKPAVQPFGEDIGGMWASNEIADQVAAGKLPKESLDGIDVMNKSGLQIVGDTAQFVLAMDMGGKTTSMFSNAAEKSGLELQAQLTDKSLVQALSIIGKQGIKEGALNGFEFGVAQALSSGSSDPMQIAQILVSSTAGGAIIGGATSLGGVGKSLAVKYLSDVVTGVNAKKLALQEHFVNFAITKGYSREEAMKMLYQGGYVGGIGEKPPGEPSDLPQPPSPPQIKERGFITSVKNNPEVAADVAHEVQGIYQVQTDVEAVQRAATLIKDDPLAARQLAMGDEKSKDAVTTAMLLFKDANNRYKVSTVNGGNADYQALREAVDIAQHLAVKGTEAGQAIQAYSLLGKDLGNPDQALVASQKYLDRFNRSKIPLFDQHIDQISKGITDFNGRIADEVIASFPELQPKEEVPAKGQAGPEVPKPKAPAAQKPSMDISAGPKIETPRSPLTDLIYAEGLINPDESPEQKLAKKVKIEQAVKAAPKPVQDMINTLYKIAQEDLPAKGKAVPRDPIELMGQAIRDKATYRDVFKKAQDLVRVKYLKNPEALDQLEQFFGRDLSGELPVAEKQVSSALKNQMQEGGINLADVVKQHYTVYDQTGKELAQKIAEKADVSPEDARALAERIQQKFNELGSAKKESLLRQMFKERKLPVKKTDIQKLNELTNLGAFDKPVLRDSLAKKMGLATLSDADAKMIMDRSLNIQALPEGAEKSYQTNLLRKQIADLKPQSKTSKFLGVWKQGLFSAAAPKKFGGELTMQALENTSAAVATGFDKFVSSVFGTDRTRAYSPSVLMKSLASVPDAYKSSLDFLHSEVGSGLMSQFSDQMGKYDISDFKHGTKYSQNPTVNMWANLPSRILGMTTDFFQNVSLPSSLLEQARVGALNEGLKGQEFNARVKELYLNPSEEMVNQSIDHALYMTFQDNSNFAKAGEKLKEMLREGAGDIVSQVSLPVYKTPANIFSRLLVDYGPLAFPKMIADQLRGGFDQGKLATQFGRATTGSVLMYLGGWLAARGLMTGAYPSTREERAVWATEGRTPNSILIGGEWRNLGTAFAPVGELMGLGSDFYKLGQDNSGVALASQSIFSTLKTVGDMPMLFGLSTELQAVQQPEQFGAIFAENLEASAIPAVVRQTARATDPTKRNPRGFIQQLEARVPGLTGKVPVARDVFGMTSTYPGGHFANFDPFQSSPNRPNPVLDEAQRLGISMVAPNQTLDGVKMTNDEYSTYQKYRGYYMALSLGKIIHSPTYTNLSDDGKATLFNEAKTQSGDLVNNTIFPQLMMKRYGLPSNVDPSILKTLLTKLGKNNAFKKASTDQQAKVIKYWLHIQ